MGHPGNTTEPAPLDQFVEDNPMNGGSAIWSPNFDFDLANNETIFNGPGRTDESCIAVSDDQYDQYTWGVFDELENGGEDGLCKQATLNERGGKCACPACSKKSFDKDLREIFNFETPDAQHVFSFQMPPDDISGMSDTNTYSPDLPLLRLPARDAQDLLNAPTHEASGNKPGKRRRTTTERPISDVEDALALMKDALRSDGPLSENLKARMRQLLDGEEQPHQPQSPATFYQQRGAVDSSCTVPMTSVEPLISQYIPPILKSSLPSQLATPASIHRARPSRYHEAMTSDGVVESGRTKNSKQTLYYCTFKSCYKVYRSRYEWKRHEESVHKQRYMCMECGAGTAHPHGGYACGFCFAPLASLDAVKAHTIQCTFAREAGKSYPRKDKLRDHLRDDHWMLEIGEKVFDWVYDVDGDWPRECGFCGISLNDWDLRACHLEIHFKDGLTISNWRIPFRRTGHMRSRLSKNGPSDEDEDDDDDDNDDDPDCGFDDTKGNGGIVAFRQYPSVGNTNNQTTSSGSPLNHQVPSQYPLQELDAVGCSDWDSESANDRSDSTYTQTPGRVSTGLSIIQGHPSNSTTPHLQEKPGNIEILAKIALETFSALGRYLSDDQQHERFLLGFGRRPLNLIIGAKKHPEPSTALVRRQSDIQHRKSQLNSSFLATRAKSRRSPLSQESGPNLAKCVMAVPQHSMSSQVYDDRIDSTSVLGRREGRSCCLEYLEQQHAAETGTDRARSLEIHEKAVEPQLVYPQKLRKTKKSALSVVSSVDTLSRHSSASSATSISTSVPPWHQPRLTLTLNQHISMAPYDYGYDLPCEFAFLGCRLRFHPGDFEIWISHSTSHFVNSLPPPKAICTFCDDKNTTFESRGNVQENWRERMIHIGGHFQDLQTEQDLRPDFWVIEHLRANGLISVEDYTFAIKYTERPRCNGLVPLGYETPETLRKAEMSSRVVHKLEKENHQLRKGKQKDKSKETQNTSGMLGKPAQTQIGEMKMHYRLAKAHSEWGLDGQQTEKKHSTLKEKVREERCQGYYEEETDSSLHQERQLSLLRTSVEDNFRTKLLTQRSGDPRIMPGRTNHSSSEQLIKRYESRGSISIRSQVAVPFTTPELSTNDPFKGPKMRIDDTQTKQAHMLQDDRLHSPGSHCSDHIPNSGPARALSKPPLSKPILSSNLQVLPSKDCQSRNKKPIIHSREPPIGSRTSRSSESSTSVYATGSCIQFVDEPTERRHRVPDDDKKYIKTTSRGKVDVVSHRTRRIDTSEPRASEARAEDYEHTQRYYRRRVF